MKRINGLIRSLLIVLMLTLGISCSDDGGSTIFLPDLSRDWYNKDDVTNTFFFLPDNVDVATSNFTGNENPIGGGAQYSFTGSFNNNQVQFTYNNTSGAKSGKTYTGTINEGSTMMTLNSSTLGNLVLLKKP